MDARAAALVALLQSYNISAEQCVPGHPVWPELKRLLAAVAGGGEGGGKGSSAGAAAGAVPLRAPFRPASASAQAAPSHRRVGGAYPA